uniref:Plastocyanin-like domain-containing protein n=1 Tax=Strigamia maritima TaxID=126957 RepID=T1IW54_STRMM
MIVTVLICFTFIRYCSTVERHYYIAIAEEDWDYAPGGNLIYTGNPKDTDLYLKLDPSVPTPGTKYKKSLLRRYTDITFTERVEAPKWQGMIGPFIKAEVGDTLIVYFQNQSPFSYTIHPHGVFYNKDSEGALYADGTSGKDKLDDHVQPGDNHTYIWSVRPEYEPKENDPNCITYIYHSHQLAQIQIMTGAIGMMAICKKGILDAEGNRKDVDKDFALLFAIFDENFSQYRKENIEAAGITEEAVQRNFFSFHEGNQKHSINGYIYGNLPGLDVCLNDKISLHLAVIGNDFDLHTVYLQGQTMEIYRHTTDTVGLYPGYSLTASIDVENEGKWLLSSQGRDSIKAGMQAFFNVKTCDNKKKIQKKRFHHHPKGKTRTYYIAAEEVMWDYAPSGVDQETGIPLSQRAPYSFGSSSDLCILNGKYKKAIYKGYSDPKFKIPLKRPKSDEHLGFLGQSSRLKLETRSNSQQQGTQFKSGPEVAVYPNEKREYTWTVPYTVGPAKADADCLFGRYYSAIDEVKDTFTGLNGPLLVCKKGTLKKTFKKINKQFYLLLSNIQETESHYWSENVERACGNNFNPSELADNFTYTDANTMRSINGYTYGNLPGLRMMEKQNTDWYISSTGYSKGDLHTPYFHGNTFDVDGTRKDTFALVPDVFKTLHMCPDNPGTWLIEDMVQVYSNGKGLSALYTVDKNFKSKNKPTERKGKIRKYCIGVIEEVWDYFPNVVYDAINGERLDEDHIASQYYNQGDTTIGHFYKKAMYREFTDETFTVQKERTKRDVHLGTMGPFIKAEVGDTIRVVFKNLATFNFSMQPHGVFYDKANEGQKYNDGTLKDHKGDSVGPGGTHVYEWSVPTRAGPSYDDFSCIFWPYMSGVNEDGDMQAGLLGLMVICRTGILDKNGVYNLRTDVNREFALFYNINNENLSPYLDENIRLFTNKPEETLKLKTSPVWIETNQMMAINGFSYNSMPNVDLYLGEKAAFYLISLGDIFETHTVHWHGNTFVRRLSGLHTHDVIDVLPGDFTQVELIGVNPGIWLTHCHIGNHSQNGMFMMYRVLDPDVSLRE